MAVTKLYKVQLHCFHGAKDIKAEVFASSLSEAESLVAQNHPGYILRQGWPVHPPVFPRKKNAPSELYRHLAV